MLSSCGQGGAKNADQSGRAAPLGSPEYAYRSPPVVLTIAPLPGDRVVLDGHADAGSRVRLGEPGGAALFTRADGAGRWRLKLPPASGLRLIGLSMTSGARTVQSEGYLAVTPQGQVAQLRSGASARVLGAAPVAPRADALDYDRRGGAMLSGKGPPNAHFDLMIDGAAPLHLTIDPRGRFSVALDEPLALGDHRIEINFDGRLRLVTVPISRAPPLAGPPFRATRTPLGWRIDWLTPGGGLQTTQLIDPAGGAQ